MGHWNTVATPDGWLSGGEPICNNQRPPVTVWQGIVGERCHVHVFHHGQHRNQGRWDGAVDKPHPHRIDPPCDRYSPCGGCPWMHMDLAGQAEQRLGMLRRIFSQAGLPDLAPREVVAGPDGDREYRHLVKLAVGSSDRGHIRLGAFGRNSRDVIPIPGCLVATEALREAMKLVAHLVITKDIWPYDPRKKRGLLRYVVMRQSRATGRVLITLVAARRNPLLRDLAEELSGKLPQLVGVHVHVNASEGNNIFEHAEDGSVRTRQLDGQPYIEERLAGLRLRVGAGDFFQTNPGVAERILRDLVQHLPAERPVVDLYCGVGGLTLAAARRAGWALGVEEVASAVIRARSNASLNEVPAEFMAGRVEDKLDEVRQRLGGRAPVVLVNPPRRGLEPSVVEGIRALEPVKLIYLSCNPRSLARDLADLALCGLELSSCSAYDMFPHTPHVETMAVLEGKAASAKPIKRPPRRRKVRAR